MTDERVSLERARAILARATEIETQFTGSISLGDLRSIGLEAGIDERAVDLAIHEETEVSRTPEDGPPVLSWPLRGLLAGGAWGAATGIAVHGISPFMGPFLGTSGVIMTAGILAGVMRKTHTHLRFQLANGSLWLGYTGARLVVEGGFGNSSVAQVIVQVMFAAAATGTVGAAIVGVRNRRQRTIASGGSGARPSLKSVMARVRSGLAGVWENLKTPLWRQKRRGECSHVI